MGHTPSLNKPTKEGGGGALAVGLGPARRLPAVRLAAEDGRRVAGQRSVPPGQRQRRLGCRNAGCPHHARGEGVGSRRFFAYVDRGMTEPDLPNLKAIKDAKFGDYTAPRMSWVWQGSVSVTGAKWVKGAWQT